MADYLNITDTAVDPDAPLTSQLAYAWRDNPIAIAEGASGAPRVMPLALDLYIGRVLLPTTANVALTDLNPNCIVAFVGGFSNGIGDSATVSITGSSDNGATWGFPNLITPSPTSAGRYSLSGTINLKNGLVTAEGASVDIGTDINAVRFQLSAVPVGSGADNPAMSFYYIGRA